MSKRMVLAVAAVLATWAAAVAVTRRLAPRLDRGSESSPEIRRAVAAGQLRLPDLAPPVRHVHLDLVMAGAEIGWRPDGTDDGATGLDLTVHAKLSGLQIMVPPRSRVWWRHWGPGGSEPHPGRQPHESRLARGCGLTDQGRARLRRGVGHQPALNAGQPRFGSARQPWSPRAHLPGRSQPRHPRPAR